MAFASKVEHVIEPKLWNPPPLLSEHLRLVILVQVKQHDKVIMYDSDLHMLAFQQAAKEPLQATEPSKQHVRNADVLKNIVFGQSHFAFTADTTKIHELPAPRRIAVSKLFRASQLDSVLSQPSRTHQRVPVKQHASRQMMRRGAQAASIDSAPSSLQPNPLSLPALSSRALDAHDKLQAAAAHSQDTAASLEQLHHDAQHTVSQPVSRVGSVSSFTTASSVRSAFGHHIGSRWKRMWNSQGQRIDYGVHPGQAKVAAWKGTVCACSLLIDVQSNSLVKQFVFTHFALIEMFLSQFERALTDIFPQLIAQIKAKEATLKMSMKRTSLLGARLLAQTLQTHRGVFAAVSRLKYQLKALYSVPRLQEPVWLTLVTYTPFRKRVRRQFLDVFQNLLKKARKGTKSGDANVLYKGITASLIMHLGWVTTVTPTSDTFGEQLSKCTPASLSLQAKAHPYDALWAQLSDLYGAFGSPVRVGKTVVVGKDRCMVLQYLYVLSYFLRCGEVYELETTPKYNALTPEQGWGKAPSATPSTGGSPRRTLHQRTASDTSLLSFTSASSSRSASCMSLNMLVERSDGESASDGEGDDSFDDEQGGSYASSVDALEDRSITTMPITAAAATTSREGAITPSPAAKGPSIGVFSGQGAGSGSDLSDVMRRKSSTATVEDPDATTEPEQETEQPQERRQPVELALSANTTVLQVDETLTDTATRASSQKANTESTQPIDEGAFGYQEEALLEETSHFTDVSLRSSTTLRIHPDLTYDAVKPSRLSLLTSKPKMKLTDYNFHRTLGRSLLTGVSEKYVHGAALQGVLNVSQASQDIVDDLQNSLHLTFLAKNISSASCTVLNLDNKTCSIISATEEEQEEEVGPVPATPDQQQQQHRGGSGVKPRHSTKMPPKLHVKQTAVVASAMLVRALDGFAAMAQAKLPREFCLEFLEDSLQTVFSTSRLLTTYLEERALMPNQQGFAIGAGDLATILSVDESDIPLLLAVAGTHSPGVHQHVVLPPTIDY
eukprot:m.22475 g.22475  ORF g.22475 m.22475 type:complete len:1009 (+) comp8392_c0_seq4:251-3277(+)